MLALVDTELECGPDLKGFTASWESKHVLICLVNTSLLGTCSVPALGGCWESSHRDHKRGACSQGVYQLLGGACMVSLFSLTVVTRSLWVPLSFT